MTPLYLLIIAACAAGACTDVAFRRIPNWLTFGTAAAAILLQAQAGLPAMFSSILAMAAVMAAGLTLFSLRLIGGGDVKLMAAVSAAAGFPACVDFILYTMLAGGFVALGSALLNGSLQATFSRTFALAYPLMYRVPPLEAPASGIKIPYGVAIFAGACILVVSGTIAPFLRLPV